MVRDDWRMMKLSEIIGIPDLNVEYVKPQVFLSLKERIRSIENLGALILYGATVNGDVSSKSDIDLMAVPEKNDNIQELREQLGLILRDIENVFDLELSFSLNVYDGKEDTYFLWELVNDGVVLFCKPGMLVQSFDGLKPFALISYSFSGVLKKDKKRALRYLYESDRGLKINKDSKLEYIGPGVIKLPQDKTIKVTELFDELGIKYSFLKIWM